MNETQLHACELGSVLWRSGDRYPEKVMLEEVGSKGLARVGYGGVRNEESEDGFELCGNVHKTEPEAIAGCLALLGNDMCLKIACLQKLQRDPQLATLCAAGKSGTSVLHDTVWFAARSDRTQKSG